MSIAGDFGCTDSGVEQFVLRELQKLRLKLLDLTTRNPLISFNHSSRSRRYVRAVDELPDRLFARLQAGSRLKFRSLGDEATEPDDEKTIQFRRALDAAKLADPEYRQKLEEAGEDPGERVLNQLELDLRIRLRAQLNMPPRPTGDRASASEVARQRGITPSFELPLAKSNAEDKRRGSDLYIQTLLFEDPMELTLAKIQSSVVSSIQESGVNPLFCVFGFLEWYEDANSQLPLHAPLLLYPLNISRDLIRGQYHYTVSSTGEDIGVNVALAERLKQQFDLVLPPFDDEEGDTPESYFAKVETVIQAKGDWKVRRFITIGLFSFARIAMYHDLDPVTWEAHGDLRNHPKLAPLLGGGTADEGSSSLDSDDHNTLSDAEFETPLIADADSSQLAAIREVLNNRDLIIEGPPGTGKSQTITNIIAASLAAGKTVLFLAEKMAALNVVKKRLDDAGLGPFCLELHSTKSGRKETFAALGKRLSFKPPKPVQHTITSVLDRLEALRRSLRDCVEALAEPAGMLDMTTQQLLWRCQLIQSRTAPLPSELDEVHFPEALELTQLQLGELVDSAERFEAARKRVLQVCKSLREHHWYGVARHDMGVIEAQDTVGRVKRLAHLAARARDTLAEIKDLTEWNCGRIGDLAALTPLLKIAAPAETSDDDLICGLTDQRTLVAAEQFCARKRELDALVARIHEDFAESPPLHHEIAALLSELGSAASEAGFLGVTVGEVTALLEDLEKKAEAWGAARSFLESIARAAGCMFAETLEGERMLIEAVGLAVQARSRIALNRTVQLISPGSTEVLKRAADRSRSLRARRDAYMVEHVFDGTPEPSILRQHAAAIRSAPCGPFAIFSSSYRRARAAFRTLCKTSFKANRLQMASLLDDLAHLKEAIAHHCADEQLRQLTGGCSISIDADLDSLLEIAEWSDAVRSRLPMTIELGRELRDALLSGPLEQIEALARCAADSRYSGLRKALCSNLLGGRSVSSRVTRLKDRVEAATRVSTLLQLMQLKPEFSLSRSHDVAQAIRDIIELRDTQDNSRPIENLMLSRFEGHRTQTAALEASAAYARQIIESSAPTELKEWLLRGSPKDRYHKLLPLLQQATAIEQELQTLLMDLHRITKIDFRAWIGAPSLQELGAAELHDHARRCADDPEGLQYLIEDARSLHELRARGLGPIVDLLEANGMPLEGLGDATRRLVYQSVARAMIAKHPALAGFTGEWHEQRRKEFRTLDHQLKLLYREQIAYELANRPVAPGSNSGPRKTWTGKALIQHEAGKQQAHIKIRDLLKRAGLAVQQLMPCFMMSPLSVAQFLTPGTLTFDLVIMDEASQLRPEDAIGAIVRARQIVVVGDRMQLPPTRFGEMKIESDSDDEDGGASAADEQSILDHAHSLFRHRQMLLWHYRSRHPSLIAFSNKEFYENKLICFPAPSYNSEDSGISYIHVSNGNYRKGVNVPEARRVAEAVMQYTTKHPDRTLGVVALNLKQADLLESEIDRLAMEHPAFEEWRRRHQDSLEPFFVKNLENVQGDERDTIFISTVYGKDEHGNFYQRFGPINNEGGHRRLNVLFTRAKYHTVVFSSMEPGDIQIEGRSWGVRALRGYLSYARNGVLDQPCATDRPPDSDFEMAVSDVLRAAGYEVVPQVGVAGYFIDIGIRHPKRPGEFVLGIECDGATYHSNKCARDRDRLRQEVLERLKWRLHRIWSLDWYRNNRRECERLLRAVKTAVAAAD